MPYTESQCRKFAMMAAGKAKGTPPKDWKEKCKKKTSKKGNKR